MFTYKIIWKTITYKINMAVIDFILSEINAGVKKKQNWIINIIFETDEAIKNLNKWYRWIDKTTDVLSFHYFDEYDDIKKNIVAWEIILSKDKIESQAKEYWLTVEEELYKLLCHSFLHLLWFDHESDDDYKEMNKVEELIEKKVNIKFWLDIK